MIKLGKIKNGLSPLGLGLILLCAGNSPNLRAQVFSQDLTMHTTTTTSGMMGRGGGSSTTVDYFTNNAMKTTSSDGIDTILRLDSAKIVTINNKNKTYTEMTVQQLQEALDKAAAKMGDNQEEMEAIKKMMGQMSGSFTVTKEGPGEPIAGYDTEKYHLTGPIEMELWAAPALKVPGAYYDVMKLRVPSNPMFDFAKMYDEMKKIDGMALKTVMTVKMMGAEMKTSRVVTSIEKGSIPASTFDVPAGYKNVPPTF